MEPITTAMAAFSAIKAGVSAGREIASLGKEIGKMFDAIDDVKNQHNKKKSSPFRSVNEEALETFMHKQQAKDMENNLREIIIHTRGLSAWQELIRLRGQIREERKAAERAAKKQRQETIEAIAIWGAVIFGIVLVCGLVVWGYMYRNNML